MTLGDILVGTTAIILLIVGLTMLTEDTSKEVRCENLVGEDIVIDGDTVEVTGYEIIDGEAFVIYKSTTTK